MRVLVFCPTYPKRPLVKRATLEALFSLDWPACELVFGRDDIPAPNRSGHHQNLFEKYARARTLAIMGDYDALLTVEADVVVPPDGLSLLVATGADVAYGLYCSRRENYGHHWLLVQERGTYYAEPASRDPDYRREAWGKVVESQGYGLGCTLIRREVLERIPFRYDDPAVACDWWFALDCQAAGVRQVHHCGVACGHYLGNEILWPDPESVFRRTTTLRSNA